MLQADSTGPHVARVNLDQTSSILWRAAPPLTPILLPRCMLSLSIMLCQGWCQPVCYHTCLRKKIKTQKAFPSCCKLLVEMKPSGAKERVPSDGDHPTTKPTLPCSPAEHENTFIPGTTGNSFSISVAQVLLRVLPPSINSLHFEFLHSAPHLILTNCSTTELL